MLRLLLLLLAPALFWAAYHRYKDRHRPEPVRNLLLSYGLGIGAGLLVVRIYQALDLVGLRFDAYELAQSNPMGLFLYAVLVIGVVEELVKFVPFWLIGMRLHHFDEPIDGIIYASFVALGFATYENIHYLQLMKGTEAVMRAIASPLVHVMFASIWGYACSRAQMAGGALLPAALGGLALAALAHGLYDFAALGLGRWVHIAPPAVILTLWIWRLHLIRRLQARWLEESGSDGER